MLNFLGGTRGCAGALTRPSTRHLQPKNFEKTALRKRGGIFTIKMGGGHNYDNYCTVYTLHSILASICSQPHSPPDVLLPVLQDILKGRWQLLSLESRPIAVTTSPAPSRGLRNVYLYMDWPQKCSEINCPRCLAVHSTGWFF